MVLLLASYRYHIELNSIHRFQFLVFVQLDCNLCLLMMIVLGMNSKTVLLTSRSLDWELVKFEVQTKLCNQPLTTISKGSGQFPKVFALVMHSNVLEITSFCQRHQLYVLDCEIPVCKFCSRDTVICLWSGSETGVSTDHENNASMTKISNSE